METRVTYIWAGFFTIILLAGTIFFTLWINRVGFDTKGQQSRYHIYFKGSVTGLRVNEDVRYNGIPIGRVEKISIDKEDIETVKVLVSIAHPDLIREDTVASIEAQGLTGHTYVQMQGGLQKSRPLVAKKSDPYPVILSKPSNIEKLFHSAPQILEKLESVTEKLNTFLNQKNYENLEAILEHVQIITKNLKEGNGSLDSTLQDFRSALQQFEKTLNLAHHHIEDLGEKSSTTLLHISKSAQEIGQVVQENREALKSLTHHGLKDMGKALTQITQAAQYIQSLSRKIGENPKEFLTQSAQRGYKLP